MIKRSLVVQSIILIFQAILLVPNSMADESGGFITGGETSLNIRYRYEQVDQAGMANNANASTIRTRLGYRTRDMNGFSAFIEMEDIHSVFEDDYNTPGTGPVATDVGPKNPGYPVIADPVATELNQSYLQIKKGGSTVKFGRQRIIRGSARFVGNVGWRQNEQTYDGFSYLNTSSEKLEIFAAYISNRNTITFTDIDMDTSLFDISYAGVPGGKLTFYYYDVAVDVNNGAFWETTGLRYTGGRGNFNYTLEFASQEQRSGVEPNYSLFEAGYKFNRFSVSAGIETLGSATAGIAQAGFATPLATLHKFNGWADVFLATPAAGLEDTYFKIAGKAGAYKMTLVYHGFAADVGGLDFGDELDFMLVKPVSKVSNVGLKFASYAAGDVATAKVDVDKIWFWFETGF